MNMMDYIYSSVFLNGPPTRRSRPRSLCARCGGIAQDDNLLSTRPRSSDRGPCNLSIEVDGREGRQGRRRHSSTGRDSGKGNNPLYCYVVATGKKGAGSATTYRESFRTPPPEELKSRRIRSLPSSPITASVSSSRTQRKALARQKSENVDNKVETEARDGGSPPLIKQTDCSPSLISLLNNENGPETQRPAKGKGNASVAAKGKAHQPLWSEAGSTPPPAPSKRHSGKGLAHQPLWTDGADVPAVVSAPRRSAKGLAHQPLWTDGADAAPPAPTLRRSAKGLSHQPLWTDAPPDPAPARPSRRAAARSVSESEVLPAAGIKTQPQSALSSTSNLMTWVA